MSRQEPITTYNVYICNKEDTDRMSGIELDVDEEFLTILVDMALEKGNTVEICGSTTEIIGDN